VVAGVAVTLASWVSPLGAPAEELVGVGQARRTTEAAPQSQWAPALVLGQRAAGPPLGRAGEVQPTDDIWTALAMCESSMNPKAVSPLRRYFGAFQFSEVTWHWLGLPGNPADHSYEVQLEAAKRLQSILGWKCWPTCARRLGLIPSSAAR
jgi:hypothetical protein